MAGLQLGKMSKEDSQAVIDDNSHSKFIGRKDKVNFVSFASRGII